MIEITLSHLAIAAIGAAGTFLIVIGAFWDSRDLGMDTGGTGFRRGPHGDPWWNRGK